MCAGQVTSIQHFLFSRSYTDLVACALFANDDETLCTVARWFMKDYQFTTDAYRFHAALNRLCQGPNGWYNAGPSQKYILRQIKAMDYPLVSENARTKHFAEKASYTARDSNGNLIVNDEMDVALLVLYGHMLYSGTSYSYALSTLVPIILMLELSR